MFEKLAGRKPQFIDGNQHKVYAVLAPFLPETEEFVFEVRSDKLRRQPGEICFPGGLVEEGETLWEAAARETTEELLVAENSIELVAPLDILATPYSTEVHPFLANLRGYGGSFSTSEVKEVFTVPFAFFLQNEPKVYYNEVSVRPRDEDFPSKQLGLENYPWLTQEYSVLFYLYKERVIWGMTAKFVDNIVKLYRETL